MSTNSAPHCILHRSSRSAAPLVGTNHIKHRWSLYLQAAAANKDDKVAAAAAKAEIEKLVALKAEVGAAESGCAFWKPTMYGWQHLKNGESTVEHRHAVGGGQSLHAVVAGSSCICLFWNRCC